MNCPKCGRELLIGSDVCPVCDVALEKPQKEKTKKRRKLTGFGKAFIIGICVIIIGILCAVGISALSRHAIKGTSNGNYLNGGLAFDTGKHFYYSTQGKLYCSNKKFSGIEEIDTRKSLPIGNIVEAGGCIYYTKDGGIYQFNPKTRKIKSVCTSGEKLSVAGFSEYEIFYNTQGRIFRLRLSDMAFEVFAWGEGVFDNNKLYLIENKQLFCIDPRTYERKPIVSVEQYASPAFVTDKRLFCCDKSAMQVFSVGLRDGDIRQEFDASAYKNISDVEHVNINENYLLLRGENGVYKLDCKTKETVLLDKLGFVQETVSLGDYIYTYSPDGTAHFSDLNGNIKHNVTPEG